jgi:hypothetical protein
LRGGIKLVEEHVFFYYDASRNDNKFAGASHNYPQDGQDIDAARRTGQVPSMHDRCGQGS